MLELFLRHQGAAAVAGEEFVEQRAVVGIADQVATPHAATASLGGGVQQLGLVIAAQALDMGRNLQRAQFAHQIAGFVQQTAFGAVEHQLVGLQIDGRAGGYVFAGQVEDFPGGRITQR